MTDWANPTTQSQYPNVLADLKDRDVSAVKLFNGVSDSNVPVDAIGYDASADRLRKWSGSAWSYILQSLYTHIAIDAQNPGNPHGTTAAMVGAPTTTAFNNHASSTSNPHATTAGQVGAPTLAAFNAHANSISNPHSTTAAQVGALAVANNLSELSAQHAAARTNIQAASAASLASHTGDTNNPHATTRAQLGAAASGTNTDITALSGASSLGWQGGSTNLHCGGGGNFLFNFAGSTKVRMVANSLQVPAGLDVSLGDSSELWNNVHFKGKLRRSAGVGSWTFFGGQPITISSLNSELALEGGFSSSYPQTEILLRATARSVNQMAKWLIDHGIAD